MALQTIFHGSEAERFELLTAIQHNCACLFAMNGTKTSNCEPHRALVEEQRFMDGLLFSRYRVKTILAEEFSHGPELKPSLPYRRHGELQP